MGEDPCVIWLNNPFDLSDVTHYQINETITIQEWVDSHGGLSRINRMPTVCVYDGKELMRSEYNQSIEKPVCFVILPTGGDSGTNPLAAIAMIALSVYVPGAVAGLGGAFSTTTVGVTSVTSLTFTGAMVSAGIMMGGAMLINMVFPPPGLPSSASPAQASTTYSLQAQGNSARLGGPIPVNYGRMRIYPDFAATPYSEYESNEQYLYQLFCIGQGQNRVSEIRLENTPIENFEEATIEIIPPMGKVTLFHTAVAIAPEAGGQDLSDPISLGPYVLNDSGTEVSRVACDIVFPGGLMGVDEGGDEYTVGVHLRIWVESVDDDGDVIGGEIPVFDETISDRTRTAIRRTLAADVPPARYQMTITRITDTAPNNETKSCQLGAMKGYLVDDNEYGDLTLLAMRVRATANISDAASRLVNVLNERLIPVWDPDNGWTVEPVITRNPSWAFADAVRARYGGDFSDAEIDLHGLHYLAGLFDERGDCFDGRFDTEQSLWDGLGKIGQVCRSGPVRQGNLIRLIRDQLIETPTQLFGMANMSELSIDYVMHDDRTADSVKVTYWDETRDYTETTVLAQLPDDTADNPQEITLFGCCQYEQAWREGMYLAASNRERRQLVSWKTGMEGHIPTFGDLVWINHDLLSTDQQFGGTVEAVTDDVLTLSRDVLISDEATWYIIIRNRYGEPSDPIPIESVDSHHIRLLDTLPYIETDSQKEPSHFVIGKGQHYAAGVKITAITPEDLDSVAIAGCIESELVHTADQGEIPPAPPPITPPPPGLDIDDLISTQGGTAQNPVIYLSWAIAPGADHYQVEYRISGSGVYQPAGSGFTLVNSHEFTCEPGMITCRVSALAAVRGDWAEITVNAGGDFEVPERMNPQLSEPFEGESLRVVWQKEPSAARYLVEVWSSGHCCRSLYLNRDVLNYEYHYTDAQRDSAGRTITVKVLAQNAENINGEFGEVTATNEPPDTPDNVEATGLLDSLVVSCEHNDSPDIFELRVYGEQRSGFTPSADNLLARSANSLVNVPVPVNTTWWVRLAWVDVWGTSDLNFSGEYRATAERITETEITENSISTPLLKANAVTAEKISVDELSAISANLGHATAGTFETDAGAEPKVVLSSQGDYPLWIGQGELDSNGDLYFDKTRNELWSHDLNSVRGRFDNASVTGTLSGSTITGGDITGASVHGGYIIGSEVIAGELSYPTEAGIDYPSDLFPPGTPDIPVSAVESVQLQLNSGQVSVPRTDTDSPDKAFWLTGIPLASCDYNSWVTSQRFRFYRAPQGWYKIEFTAESSGYHSDRSNGYIFIRINSVDIHTLILVDVFHNNGAPTGWKYATYTDNGLVIRGGMEGQSRALNVIIESYQDAVSGQLPNFSGVQDNAIQFGFSIHRTTGYKTPGSVDQIINLNNSYDPAP